MPKQKDEHSREWGRKFKTVGSAVGKYTALTLGNMAPGISGSVSSTRMAIREGTSLARQKKTEFKRYYDRVTGGKQVKDAIGDALRDIKNGSFDINKYRMESDDTYDDFDDMIGDYDSEISSASDPDQAALAESKRNTAILGRTIAEGNVGMIKSVSRMTDVLAKTNMKISNINTQKLANVTLAGLNQVNVGIAGTNARLDAINANLISMMDFQRSNTAVLNERTIEYQQNTENLLKEMGQTISEFRDFMEKQKEITKKKEEYDGSDFSMGFDMNQYVQMVKKNFKRSSLGMNLMMGGTALSMMSSMGGMMGGGNPLEMILPSIFGAFIPKGFKRRVGRMDKAMMQSIDNLLYRIGDLRYSNDSIGSTIGQIFGKERPNLSKGPNLSNFKKDAMAWNGIAQKSLVEVIPAYLARIEKNTSKNKNAEERFFDMDTGKFNTRSNLEEEYRRKMSSTIEWNMRDFTESLNDTMKDFHVSDDAKANIQKSINDAFHDVLLNGGVDYQKKSSRAMRTMYGALSQQGIDSTEIHDLVMQATKSLTDTMTELQSVMGSLNSATVHLFNDKSRDTTHLLNRRGNIFSGDKFTSSGIRVSDIEDESMRAMYENLITEGGEYAHRSKIYDDVMGKLFGGKDYEKNPLYKRFLSWSNPATAKQRKRQRLEADKKKYGAIDNLTNRIYDFMNGYDFSDLDNIAPENEVSEAVSQPSARQRASSYAVAKRSSHITGTRNLNRVMQTMSQRNMRNAIESSPKAIEAQGRRTAQAIRSAQSGGGNGRVRSGNTEESLATRMEETETSVKTAVAALNDNFAGPMMNSLAGKDNVFKNLTSKENLQDINRRLFDEKDGIFKGVGNWFRDQMDYVKYTFTGKKYTDRQGNTHDENTNSVMDHLLNGYNFIYTNAMKYLFGSEYGNNETYKKYLKWADFKSKRDKKREERLAAETEQDKVEESAGATQEEIDQRRAERKKRHFRGLRLQPNLRLTDGKAILTEDDNDRIRRNFIEASEKAAENIQEASKEMTKEVIGDFGENGEGSEVLKKEHAKSNKSFFEKAKKFLPKGIAAALLGGAIGTSVSIHGAGLIGSLFLPSGVIGGAVLGTAGALLASSDTFKSFLFGKKNKDGENTKGSEGFVSQKTQSAFKKALPLVVGAGTLGALKYMMKGAIGAGAGPASGPTGFFLNSLLPGGPLGAAVLGLGIGLLKNNDRFKSILFGESSDEEDKKGGALSKPLNALNQIMKKSGHFIKAGGKGALIGAGTGLAVSKMGLLGAAIGPAGPIGLGLLGFGLGVASQTEKFKEYMFGQEEFDENGNSKGRKKTGLLYQVRNLLVTRVFEPIGDTLMENVEDFAFWAKKNIMRPFQKAVGPIIDSARSIKKHFTDKINDFFNKLGESVIGSFKTVFNVAFKPMAKVAGAIGQAATKGVFGALKFSLAPLTGSLKVLEIATGHLRKKMMKEENRSVFEHFGDIIGGIVNTTRDQWANDNRDYSGPLGGLNKVLTRGRDIFTNTRQGFDTARAAYRKGQEIEGGNTLDWRNFREHAKFDKKQKRQVLNDRKTWRKVNDIRANLANANKFGEINLSQKGLEEVRSQLEEAGFSKEIASRYVQNNEQLNELVYNREKFKDRLRGKGETEPAVRDSSATQAHYERTEDYQNYIMDKFDTITKLFVRLGVQDSLKNKQRVDFEDLKKIDRDLKKYDMNWDELHINPADMLNINSLSEKDFDEYMTGRYEGPDAHPEDESTGFSKFVRTLLDRQEATDKTNEAIKENFEKLNETSEANLRMNISSQAFASGASESAVESAAGVDVPSGTFKLAEDSAKAKERAEEKAAEQRESEAVKAANTSSQDEDKEKEKEEKAGEKEAKEDATKKGGTVFDSIKGFASKAFSFAGNLFGDSKVWKAVGISAVVGGLFAKEIGGFAKKVYEFAKPAIDVVVEKVPQVISTAATWIGENAPRLISSLVDRVCENMGFIVENGFKIIWSAVSTIGMKLANKAAKLAHVPVPFPSVEKDEKTTYTFNQETGEFEEHTELDSDVLIDEEGNKSYVTRGEHGIKNSLPHLAFQAVRGTKGFKLGAKATGKALKYGGKALGWVTGVIPGLKIGSGIIKGSVAVGGGIARGGKSIYNAIKGKGASAVVEEAVEATGDKAVKEAVEAAAETAVKDTAEVAATKKGIKKLLDKVAEKVATASNAVKRFFSIDKLEVAVRELIDLAAKKLESSDHKLIHKIGEHITNKTAEAAGRTAADASIVVGAGLAIFDAVNGLLDASYLFGVDEANTTPRMRIVSSAMSALLGTGFGSWLDILLEVIYMLTGKNGKKTFAHFLYKALGGDNEKLLEGIAVMEAETDRYNKANGTKITSAEYNELKNSNKSITGRIIQAGSWLWSRTLGSKEAYDKKYEDYSKYKASEEEIARYKQQLKAQEAREDGVPVSDYNSRDINKAPSGVSRQEAQYYAANADYGSDYDYTGGNIGMGAGPRRLSRRAITYGSGLNQADPRWANLSLGRFPNGAESTMATGGCGPTALSMAARAVGFGSPTDPTTVALYAKNHGFIQDGGATAGLFTTGAAEMGMKATSVNKSNLKDALSSNSPVILSGKGTGNTPYTEAGHVIEVDGLDRNGKAIVNDPMRGTSTMDISKLKNGMTHGWSYTKSVGFGSGDADSTKKNSIVAAIESMGDMLIGAADYVKDWIQTTAFKKCVQSIVRNLIKLIQRAPSEVIQKVEREIFFKTGVSVAKTAVQPLFSIYDAINGFMDTPRLFGVNEEDVTPLMRTVSTIMQVLLGINVASTVISTLLDAYEIITGNDAKQWFARFVYEHIGGDSDQLKDAIKKMEMQTDKYNLINGTKITPSDFNQLKNGDKSLDGKIVRALSWLYTKVSFWNSEDDEKYRKRYEDYSKYDVTGYGTGAASPFANNLQKNLAERDASNIVLSSDGLVKQVESTTKSTATSPKENANSTTATPTTKPSTGKLSEDELAELSVATGIPKADLRNQQEQWGANLRVQYNEYVKPGSTGVSANSTPVEKVKPNRFNTKPLFTDKLTPLKIRRQVLRTEVADKGLDRNALRRATGLEALDRKVVQQGLDSGALARRYAVTKAKNEAESKSRLERFMEVGTLKSIDALEKCIQRGYLKDGEEYKFNTFAFYTGMKVADIASLAIYKPELLSDERIPKFRVVYLKFVKSGKYKASNALDINLIKTMFGDTTFIMSLGGNGQEGQYEYKYGFPFFQTDDPRWDTLKWRGETVKSRGGDLASLAMVATALGPNFLTPDYIYNNWLNTNPDWKTDDGLDMDKVFTDGGYNAMTGSQVDGKRVKLAKLTSPSSIIAALKQKKPVVMTGYRYAGSIFGGHYAQKDAPTSGRDDYSTLVARASDGNEIAVLDPFTTLDQSGSFLASKLSDKVGTGQRDVIKNAYAIANPDGSGVDKIDLKSKKGGTSDYQSIADAKGLGKLSAIFSNFAAIGSHILDSLLGGTEYRSITSVNPIEDDVPDEYGVGTAVTTDENGNIVASESQTNSNAAAATKSTVDTIAKIGMNASRSIVEYFRYKSMYYGRRRTAGNRYTYFKIGLREPKNMPGYKMIGVPAGFSIALMSGKNGASTTSTTSKASGTGPLSEDELAALSVATGISKADLRQSQEQWGADLRMQYNEYVKPKSVGGAFKNLVFYGPTAPNPGDPTTNATFAWQYLRGKGVPAIGTAGLLGNIEKESNFMFNTGETLITKKLGTTDEKYTADIDSGAISRERFLNPLPGKQYGYGLVQWTSPGRKAGLYDLAKSRNVSIADPMTQMDTLWNELNGPYKKTLSIMNSSNNLRDVSTYVLKHFEVPASRNSTKTQNARYDASNKWYNKLKNVPGDPNISSASIGAASGYVADGTDAAAQSNAPSTNAEKMAAIANAYIASMMGEDYETAKAEYLSGGGSAATTDYTTTDPYATTANQTNIASTVAQANAAVVSATTNALNARRTSNTATNPASVFTSVNGKQVKSIYGPGPIGYGGDTWLNICVKVKQAIAALHKGYSQSGYNKITVNGETRTIRRDCSGYVSACISYYTGKHYLTTSHTYTKRSNSTLSKAGFSSFAWPGWGSLQVGDIIARNGHVEIFAGLENGKHMVWNCGSDKSVNNPGKTVSGHSSYTTVWRPANPGAISIANMNQLTINEQNQMDAMGQQTARMNPAEKAINDVVLSMTNSLNSLTGGQPIAFGNGPGKWFADTLHGEVTSEYGNRSSSLGNEFHRGLDIAAEKGQDILSPIDGVVVSGGSDPEGYGNYSVIRDSKGNNHIFAHMDTIGYGIGDHVSKNDVIGQVGSTGRSTGDHLHYEIRKNGNRYSTIDPRKYNYTSLNIHDMNMRKSEEDLSIGGGTSNEVVAQTKEKLNIAINTKNIENKMDRMIEAMQLMVENTARPVAAGNVTNNTVNNTVYGKGSDSKPVVKRTTKTTTDTGETKQLAKIHKQIASK